ncbi:hypothetical protein OIU78_012841 [Salix suchowensis]|nr:hypothetical protein OIU78_012841 [Salix suchowensis]
MSQLTLFIPLSSFFIAHLLISGVASTTFTLTNKCGYTVWPGILSNADAPALSTTGFSLLKGESKTITAPASWGGRLWGRTYCSQDSTGKFSCLTGDCGSGKLECSGTGAAPPTTLAEFKLDGYGGMDYFDNCTSTGCVVDLNDVCPSELKVTSTGGENVACKSACEAFRSPQYCCNGAFGTPDTCKPSSYSEIFKTACPRAYSYAYDDKTSTFTCASTDYQITFCPAPNSSQKASQGQGTESTNTDTPVINNTMVYEGALSQNKASPSMTLRVGLGYVGIRGIESRLKSSDKGSNSLSCLVVNTMSHARGGEGGDDMVGDGRDAICMELIC